MNGSQHRTRGESELEALSHVKIAHIIPSDVQMEEGAIPAGNGFLSTQMAMAHALLSIAESAETCAEHLRGIRAALNAEERP
jgi:hypothetical protein